jgi:hypothetical protein
MGKNASPLPPNGGAEPVNLRDALEERYLAYALSTIKGRALPDPQPVSALPKLEAIHPCRSWVFVSFNSTQARMFATSRLWRPASFQFFHKMSKGRPAGEREEDRQSKTGGNGCGRRNKRQAEGDQVKQRAEAVLA